MSMYDQFVSVMTSNMLEPNFKDYQSAIQIYKDECNNGETDFSFVSWLDNYIAHATIDGY
ncbi:hypothetical protein [Lysinibacillus sp. Bpr_S20]|uniref:hypothetical protein n=1 Tax=Lysinibacillus sp. Bpr_S20 TaxID=2933964 RepID=UPI0020130BC0|nr:hypothetical protein [Lysinibacillus sp. Bpr_S20]MCL1700816.1 hypothetical protein [Lysinibacillus sp. Bpr_S20]